MSPRTDRVHLRANRPSLGEILRIVRGRLGLCPQLRRALLPVREEDRGTDSLGPAPTVPGKSLEGPRLARMYIKMSAEAEGRGIAEHRDRLLADLPGRVLEVGAGNGLNFAHYPETVEEVTAVEPEDVLRSHAERAAPSAPVPVKVVDGHAEALPDGTYDAVVYALVLCSVPDVQRAVSVAGQVLREGGELRFYEHVRAANRLVGWIEDLITPGWAWFGGGCHPNRDTAEDVRRAGFEMVRLERFRFSPRPPFVPPVSHVIGTARAV
ncbi:MAG: class I SAM-dependent methyltransferase [Streptosporangiaceae bacterium]